MDDHESLSKHEATSTIRRYSSKCGDVQSIGVLVEAFRIVGGESWVVKHGQAALSGSKPKAPGSAGGYLLYWHGALGDI